MRILALDTAGRYGSLALCEGTEVVAEYTAMGVINQCERLLAILDRTLSEVGWSRGQLDGFAVVNGPGSFTGIRVGLATVEGLVTATGRPAVAISSLKALVLGVPMCGVPVCPVLDARKGEIYTALYAWKGSDLEEILPEQVVSPRAYADRLEGTVLLVGEGADVLARVLDERAERVVYHRASGSSSLIRASVVAAWALRELERTELVSLPPLKPHYLRVTAKDLKLAGA